MTCDSGELQTLISRDVNASRPTSLEIDQDGFELEEPDLFVSCEQSQDPFSVFCNIPQPVENDFLASMCNLQQQTDNPNSYFQRLVRGQTTQTADMATIWESARLEESVQPWYSVPDSSLQTFFVNDPALYLGFDLFQVNDMSVSDNAQQLVAVRNGVLFQSSPDGFIHAVPSSGSDPILFLGGQDTPNQATTTSPKGFVRAALFANTFFFYGNGEWQPDLTPTLAQSNIVYQSMKMWIDADQTLRLALFFSYGSSSFQTSRQWNVAVFAFRDVFSNNPDAFLNPITTIVSPSEFTNPFFMGFLTIQPDNKTLYWSTLSNLGSRDPFLMTIYFANTDDYKISHSTWELQTPLSSFVHVNSTNVFYTAALADGSIASTVTILFVTGTNMFQVNLQSNSVVQSFSVVTRALRSLSLKEALDHSRLMFALDDTLRISCDLETLTVPGQTFALGDSDFHYAYVFALSPTKGTDVWIIRNRKLFRLHNESQATWGTVWTADFPMMFAQNARVSDFGLPRLEKDVYVPSMASRWYLGTNTLAHEANVSGRLQSLPFEVARSAHQTFRYVVIAVKRKSPTSSLPTFPYAVGELQRANEYGLSQSASIISVSNDSNVVMRRANTIIWESNTHDRVSEESGTVRVLNLKSAPFAISSNNGLYLLYKIPQRNRLRLVFNPFNASRMTTWCESDIDRFNQALQMQHDFCWNSLKINTSLEFVDSRCACIGGFKLFAEMEPATIATPGAISGAWSAALPCYAPTCLLGENGIQETQTNVSIFTQTRCQNRILNISNEKSTITQSDLQNSGFRISYYTGILRGTCSDTEPCDPGNTCLNGRCVVQCTSNKECQQLFGLSQSSCVNGLCSFGSPPATFHLNWWVVFAIVCLIVLILMILLFVSLVTRHKRQRFKKQI